MRMSGRMVRGGVYAGGGRGCPMGSGRGCPMGGDMLSNDEGNWAEAFTSWVLALVTGSFHLVALLHHMAIVAWTLVCIEFNTNDVFMGSVVSNSWRYLTGWSFVAQLTYLSIRCSSDLAGAVMYIFGEGCGGSCAKRGIDSTGNIMFQAIIFPVSASVCGLFWTLYHVERELVFPGCLVDIVPKWWNHAMHTVPCGIAVFELLITGGRHCWKRKRWIAISTLQFFLLCYDICVLTTHMMDGMWLYPVYAILPCWNMRILHLATIHVLALIFYFLGDQIGSYLYAVNIALSDGSAKKSKSDLEPQKEISILAVLTDLMNALSLWFSSTAMAPQSSDDLVCPSRAASRERGRNSPLAQDLLALKERRRPQQLPKWRLRASQLFMSLRQHKSPFTCMTSASIPGINAPRRTSGSKKKMHASTNRASATWVPDVRPPPHPYCRNEK